MRRTLLAAVLALFLAGCEVVPLPTYPDVAGTPVQARPGTAEALLATLPVKGPAPGTGYRRDQFGKGWADLDGNGCDSRRDVLARQAVRDIVLAGAHQCVLTAVIHDPYTDRDIASKDADVDHRVALKDAWTTGAQQLSPERREALANDPDELVAVDASTNRSKADANAASFLPPNKAYRCQFVAAQIQVKARYELWVTPPERDAIARVLASCPGQQVPS